MQLATQFGQLSLNGKANGVSSLTRPAQQSKLFKVAAPTSAPRQGVVTNVVRIANRDLKDNWTIAYALTGIVGIGYSTGRKICEDLGIRYNQKAKYLTQEELAKIREEVANYTIEGDVRTLMRTNIQRKVDIKCYQGLRHQARLPVRGQRTKTNARTRKGRKKTVAGKKM